MKSFTDDDWAAFAEQLNDQGYAHLPNVLSHEECFDLSALYNHDGIFRKTIDMQRYRFGKGEYKYFNYPLPGTLQLLREQWYAPLASLANQWMKHLSLPHHFPPDHAAFLKKCHEEGQNRPTPLMLKYETGGFNTMHQDLYGTVFFPFQVVFVLRQRGKDFEGGQFVMLEQVPRAQSRAHVLDPDLGDAIIFTTGFRPVKGTRGYYRAAMKHGISAVTAGERYSMGLIFHDAS
ncbi:MAG TPA: 2OG-Fe(II) oxygenase [Ohtaekwangia sp.]|nr:2OG-Fe(II) oxygenase [Ohtaekwangia sp.]